VKIPDRYIIFDLETTGFSPQYAEIIEIGAVRVVNGLIVGRFQSYVNPYGRIPANITALTGISSKQTASAPRIDGVFPKFKEFIGSDVLIAHNSSFDCRFLAAVCCMLCETLDNSVLDSVQIAKAYIKGVQNYKLETLKNHFGIKLPSHNAIDDCTVTYNVVEYCRKKQNGIC
jgi:DNA polymerase-3 subunit alpha (Gram-positive type)